MPKGRKLPSRPPPAAPERLRSLPVRSARTAAPDAARILHELRVHQVELEIQNEELRTARLEMETALSRYTELFEFAPVGYATMDGEDCILDINHAGAKLLGGARSMLRTRNFRTFVEPQDRTIFCELILAARNSGAGQCAELRLYGEDLRRVPVRLSVSALPQAHNQVLAAFEDITELKRNQEQLELKEKALRAADRRKDEFLAALSHELRNPLAPIRNSLFLLEHSEPGSEGARRSQHVIDRQVTHLTRLIDDLLDATRIARGKIQLQLQPVELGELVQSTAEDHRPSFDAAGVALDTNLEAATWVQGDPARLVQVVSNVLTNALKFTPAGGQVRVRSSASSGRVDLCISDSGVGIPADVLAHVFEPFAQAPQILERAGGGLGLGLALVKGLIELHGGGVSVRSLGLGSGTDVQLWLRTCPPPEAVAPGSSPAAGSLRRILLIEDNADAAETLRAALALKGHQVSRASDGASALQLAMSSPPEIVICDIGLPGMDGYDVARAFRARPALRHAFLVALTGYAQAEDLQRARTAGFDVHLAKPASVPALERLIAEAPLAVSTAGP